MRNVWSGRRANKAVAWFVLAFWMWASVTAVAGHVSAEPQPLPPMEDKSGGPRGVAAVSAFVEEHRISGFAADHWAAEAIVELISIGIYDLSQMPGPPYHINPDEPVTYRAVAWALVGIAGLGDELKGADPAAFAAEIGLMPAPAPPPGEDRPLTRLEAAHVAAHLTDFPGAVSRQVDMTKIYGDWPAIPEESRDAVYWVTINRRLFSSIPGGDFRPNDPLTLGEAAVILQLLRAY